MTSDPLARAGRTTASTAAARPRIRRSASDRHRGRRLHRLARRRRARRARRRGPRPRQPVERPARERAGRRAPPRGGPPLPRRRGLRRGAAGGVLPPRGPGGRAGVRGRRDLGRRRRAPRARVRSGAAGRAPAQRPRHRGRRARARLAGAAVARGGPAGDVGVDVRTRLATSLRSPRADPAWTLVGIRVAYWIGAALALLWLPLRSAVAPFRAYEARTDLLFNTFAQWDAQWFVHIADHGYDSKQATPFFPLYPLLVHALSQAIGSTVVAGVLLLLAALALTWVAWKRLGPAFGLYSLATLALVLLSPPAYFPLASFDRYLLADFPVFLALAALLRNHPRARQIVLFTFAAVGAVAAVGYSRKVWIG